MPVLVHPHPLQQLRLCSEKPNPDGHCTPTPPEGAQDAQPRVFISSKDGNAGAPTLSTAAVGIDACLGVFRCSLDPASGSSIGLQVLAGGLEINP